MSCLNQEVLLKNYKLASFFLALLRLFLVLEESGAAYLSEYFYGIGTLQNVTCLFAEVTETSL